MVGIMSTRHGGSVRFMVAIDNFEHVMLAYGPAVATQAVSRLRSAILEWLGDDVELHFECGGIVYGTWHTPPERASAPLLGNRARPINAVNRILMNPPVLTLSLDRGHICLPVSGTWAVDDGQHPSPLRPFAGGCRAPYFGELPRRDDAWLARYRTDMAAAASVLAAMSREAESRPVVVGARSLAGAVFQASGPAPVVLSALKRRDEPEAEQLVMAWRPVRDGRGGPEVLFYEMCPQLVGSDGRRRDLGEVRPALERLGLAGAVDRFLVDHALDLLDVDPDVALAVPVSAQSASACSRWGDVFRRLTGDRSVARRLTLAIAETASFPDFAETIQFVSRLQTFGVAVAIDNFGLGYSVELFDSGTGLLERARSGLAGCIVLDVRMPGVSGLEVQKRLAALDIHTPVIVVSGFADIEMAVQAMKANAFEFLTKPFRDQDLFDAIGAAMELDSSRTVQSRERRQADRLIRNLTSREHEVFVRLCNGQLGKQIAHELGMSEATVKVHRRSILHKLDVRHLGELILTYAPMIKHPAEDVG